MYYYISAIKLKTKLIVNSIIFCPPAKFGIKERLTSALKCNGIVVKVAKSLRTSECSAELDTY
jgi:hypothetical protein